MQLVPWPGETAAMQIVPAAHAPAPTGAQLRDLLDHLRAKGCTRVLTAAGEIHVHSTPEQEIEFAKGTSTRKLTIKQPGIIDVEDHALNQVIVQLQVEN